MEDRVVCRLPKIMLWFPAFPVQEYRRDDSGTGSGHTEQRSR